jgi:hypothetical protein
MQTRPSIRLAVIPGTPFVSFRARVAIILFPGLGKVDSGTGI